MIRGRCYDRRATSSELEAILRGALAHRSEIRFAIVFGSSVTRGPDVARGYAEVDRDKRLAAARALGPIADISCAAVLAWAERRTGG